MRQIWLAVFVVALLFTYAVCFSGEIVSGDNIVQFYQTTQILDRGRLTFSADDVAGIIERHDWGLQTRYSRNSDGVTFSQVHGIGQSLLTIPVFSALRLARQALGFRSPADMTLWCLNWPILIAACVLLVLAICRLTGLDASWVTAITFSAAFSSPLWMYSNLPYNVVGEVLFTLAAIWVSLWLDRKPAAEINQCAATAALATFLIFAIIVRPFAATAVPAFVVWVLMSARATNVASSVLGRRHIQLLFVLLAVGACLIGGYNLRYFGSPTSTPYHSLEGVMNFNGSWLVGFAGTFLSPLKSPFYFFPLSVTFVVTLALLVWRRDRCAVFVTLFLLPQIYLMPKYSMWDGGPDLFARFWFRSLPPIFLALAVATQYLNANRRVARVWVGVVLVLSLLGVSAELLASMTDERGIYAMVASDLTDSATPDGRELSFHNSVPRLLIGATIVARVQREQMQTPRSFLFLRESLKKPIERLSVVMSGLVASLVSLYLYCVYSMRVERPLAHLTQEIDKIPH